jgi:hypothetical protein
LRSQHRVRHVFVVARGHRDLYEILTRQFSDDDAVKVVLDQRRAEPRQAGSSQEARDVGRRRFSDRRTRPYVDEELKSMSHAVVTLAY